MVGKLHRYKRRFTGLHSTGTVYPPHIKGILYLEPSLTTLSFVLQESTAEAKLPGTVEQQAVIFSSDVLSALVFILLCCN